MRSNTARVLFRVVILLLGLAALQLASWLLVGRASVLEGLPGMARADFQLGYQPRPLADEQLAPRDVVIVDDASAPLKPDVVNDLQRVFNAHGLEAHAATALPQTIRLTKEECVRCEGFAYVVGENKPLYAIVYTYHFRVVGMSSIFVHRRLWLLGMWVPMSDAFFGES